MTKDEWAEKIIAAGFRNLAKEFHPDAGGSKREFQELTEAASFLRRVRDHAEPARSQITPGGAWQLQLEMEHISTLLTGRPVYWNGPNGLGVELILRGGPGNLVADVLGKLVERYVKPKRR